MNIRSQQFFCVPYSRGLMANQLYDPLTYRINGQCFQKKKNESTHKTHVQTKWYELKIVVTLLSSKILKAVYD